MKVACKADDAELERQGWKIFECFGGKTCIVIKEGGAYRGFVNRCPHAGGEVRPTTSEEGGRVLKCMMHGSLFDLSGVALTAPAAPGTLRGIELKIEDGIIYYQ